MRGIVLALTLLAVGCNQGHSSGGGGNEVDYAGVYSAHVDSTFTDSDGADESTDFDMEALLIIQDGAAVRIADSILARATSTGLDTHYSFEQPSFWGTFAEEGDVFTPDTAPKEIHMEFQGSYPDFDPPYSYTQGYVISLGDKQ